MKNEPLKKSLATAIFKDGTEIRVWDEETHRYKFIPHPAIQKLLDLLAAEDSGVQECCLT